MRLGFLFAAAAFLPASFAARADTQTYGFTLTGYEFSGSGSFTLDLLPGQTSYTSTSGIESFSSSFADVPIVPYGSFPLSVTISGDEVIALEGFLVPSGGDTNSSGVVVETMAFNGTSFGAQLQTPNPPGSSSPYNHYATDFGSIQFSNITPEPSSFALVGTGLLGVAGVVKRRFA